jgi:N-acetylmuramoyl-L-alanine amidase
MNITQDFIPAGRNNRPGINLTLKYITIHDTANSDAGADALMHARYLKGDEAANRPVSWHFTVDDSRVIQHLALNEVGWHAGDGNGPGNMTSIAIEICENADGDRTKAEENAASLVADLLIRLNLGIDAVVQHNKWSGKNCPHLIRSRSGGWDLFLQNVIKHLKTRESEQMLKPEDANKIIKYLQASYQIVDTIEGGEAAKAEFARLANELRKASGQVPQ